MKRILVTGGAGFIGSNFIRYIIKNTDWFIYNLDALTYSGNLSNLDGLSTDRHKFIHGNILDQQLISWIFNHIELDIVVHFAAETHVDRSIIHPRPFIETNIIGTFNLINAIKTFSPKTHFHHISTDEVYGELDEDGSFSESYCYTPNSPYSASKASSDHLVRAFGHTYGLKYTISNCSNNYGPYQFPEKLIPRMVLSAIQHKPLPVHGNGENVRDWLHVDDHCRAIHMILESGEVGETYNIGGNEERMNIEVVNKICDILKEYNPVIEFTKDRLGNDKRYAIDSNKIFAHLGWYPEINFDDGIVDTVNWYLQNRDWLFETNKLLESSNYDIFYRDKKV